MRQPMPPISSGEKILTMRDLEELAHCHAENMFPSLQEPENPKPLIFIGGAPGVGKTSSLKSITGREDFNIVNIDPDDVDLSTHPRYVKAALMSQYGLGIVEEFSQRTDLIPDSRGISLEEKVIFNRLVLSMAADLVSQGKSVVYQRPWSNVKGLQNSMELLTKHYPWINFKFIYLVNENEEFLFDRTLQREYENGREHLSKITIRKYIEGIRAVINYLSEVFPENVLEINIEDESPEIIAESVRAFIEK